MSFPLNPAQREAVRTIDAPLLVLAGAGSGKTRVIAAKIAHLAASGVDPGEIAAITFTNKAAREMRERVTAAAKGGAADAGEATISTFHALGLAIMRREAKALGIKPGFSILDPSDLEPIVAELVATADRGRARAAQWRISQWKNALVPPSRALAEATDDDARAAARAYARYADTLAAYQAVDFDDLIIRPLALFERDAEAAARWSTRFAHVLVDEYQDTNPAQYALFRHLVGTRARFTAVGDDDQAIYGWRGATLDNLARLTDDYPATRVVKLEQNYRSSVRILRSANALIAHNRKLHEKRLWSDLGNGDTIRVTSCADDEAEAETVAAAISARRFEERGRYGDFAVLYRGNHQSRAMEAALRAASIPYVVSGGQSYFDRAEIRDIVAYLRLVANDDDDPAFVRAVTTPKRGIGEATLAKLGDVARQAKASLFAAVFEPAFAAVAQARAREELERFCALVNGIRHRAVKEPAGRLLTELVRGIGYDDYLVATFEREDAKARAKSVQDFVDWLARKGESDGKSLLELTQMIALVTLLEGRDGEAADAVHLSTLHAAKGLEFPHVTMIGVEEGILPHREAIDKGDVDEERRLMYVGVTRAQRTLHVTFCRVRKRAGARIDAAPSRFLAELSQEDLRYSGAPLPADEAAREKAQGIERLRALKALVARR
ncbi:MAG TPA: UvrD-helicase domain-containing protein [Casimicrobiaceae bacterium]|nr:UvrD-helicase domain-containing protein [Casimicrobiaceae bacterium]